MHHAKPTLRTRLRRLPSLILAGVFVLWAMPAQAQYGGGMGGGRTHRTEPNTLCEAAPSTPVSEGLTQEQLDYRLTVMQQDLKLTPGQLDVWLAFAEKVRAYGVDLSMSGFVTPPPARAGRTADRR